MRNLFKNFGRSFRRSLRAISPVIAVLLMIVIAVAASLVAYAWVMGYLGFTTSKVGKAIQIQSIAKIDDDSITIYVQNVGDSDVTLADVYVNDVRDSVASAAVNGVVLGQGVTLPINSDIYDGGPQVKVKVVNADGSFIEYTKTFTSASGSGGGETPTVVYYKPIDIVDAQVAGASHTDFPILITVSGDTDVGSKISGSDNVYFTLDDGTTLLSHEFESFSLLGGAASFVAWVKVPTLTPSTVLRVCYGEGVTRPAANNPADVWSSNYQGIWHLEESGSGIAGEFKDSTTNGNDGRGGAGTTNRVPTQVSGRIGYAQDFEGTDSTPDFIDVGSSSSLSITGSITLEAWVRVESWEYEYWHMIVARQYGTGSGDGYLLCLNDGGTAYIIVGSNNANRGTVATSSWYHIVGVASGSTRRVYINGVGGSTGSGVSWSLDSNPVLIGAGENGAPGSFPNEQFDGIIDEVRISNTVRSADWIQTEYNNMNNPSGFINLGSEVQVPA